MRFLFIVSILLGYVTPALSGTIEGTVKILGSHVNAETYVESTQAKQKLCANALSKKIARLSSMGVRVEGAEKFSDTKSGCFEASSFTVTQMSNGRTPLVGALSADGMRFVITDDQGQVHKLEKVSKGLKKLVGKRVIVDVKPVQSPDNVNDKQWRVVSYLEFP